MEKILECVPNFSEGQNQQVITQIKDAVLAVEGANLLHVDVGFSTNRSVFTIAGNPEAVIEAAFQAIKTASELIDMRKQKGAHPRIGSTDVCPIVPVKNMSMKECVELSYKLAERVSSELNIPIFLYEESATTDYRRNLADIRKGEYENLEKKMLQEIWKPDFGTGFNPKNGVTVMGARNFLIAYNITLNTKSVEIAKEIAARVRGKGKAKRDKNGQLLRNEKGELVFKVGKFEYLKAIGWYMDEYEAAQVSMNIIDYKKSKLHLIYEEVKREAENMGTSVKGSELIGLIPSEALLMAGEFYLQNHFATKEDKYSSAIEHLCLDDLAPFKVEERVIDEMI